jgi:phage FluMu gp28-like protein
MIEVLDHDVKLPAVMQLRGYQQRWIDDQSRFKIAVKSARIGFSYGTGVDHILRRLQRPGTTTTVLSAGAAQSSEFVQEAQKNIQAIGAVAEADQTKWADEISETDFTVQRIKFANGSRIMALACNPRTARGYPGDVVLDEFAHVEDSYAIWAAAFRQVALGNRLDALSTPNGEQGKFHDIAADLGLTDGVCPVPNPLKKGPWSGHWVDVFMAVAEGCPINISEMQEGMKDPDTFNQEFRCVFLKATGAWIPPELILGAENDGATVDWPAGYVCRNPFYTGIDIARDRDQTVLWGAEKIADVMWTRLVYPLHAISFPKQHELLDPWVRMSRRSAIDKTGMGSGIFDYLNESSPGRLMGVSFGGTNDDGVRMKVDLAIRLKRNLERYRWRIPRDPQIRQEFQSIKREATASGVTFDSPRIEIESAVAGAKKRKMFAHADRFWAAALCDLAADGQSCELGMTKPGTPSSLSLMKGFM